MFNRVDLNQDKLIDLNEFLWMQVTPQRAQEAEADGGRIHPHPSLAHARPSGYV